MIKAKFKKLHHQGTRFLSIHIWPHSEGILVTATNKRNIAHSIRMPNTYYKIKTGTRTETWYKHGYEIQKNP